MSKYFYGRISSASQSLARQQDMANEMEVPIENQYFDVISGIKTERPQFEKLILELTAHRAENPTLYVASFDRLARSTKQLLTLSELFEEMGVNLVSIHENIDTTTPQGKLFFTISGAFAEFERSIIKERQAEGIASKIARDGKCGGRKPIDKEKIETAIELYLRNEQPVKTICSTVGISRATLYKELSNRGIVRD